MSKSARIPALLRELADAFDELLAQEPPRRRKPTARKPETEASSESIAAVRRRLRSQGVAA